MTEHIISGKKKKLILDSVFGILFCICILSLIYWGGEKDSTLWIFLSLNAITFTFAFTYKFRNSPFEFIFLESGIKYFTTNLLGNAKGFEIEYSNIKEVNANNLDKPNNITIVYFDKNKKKFKRKKLFLIYLVEPQNIIHKFKDIFHSTD